MPPSGDNPPPALAAAQGVPAGHNLDSISTYAPESQIGPEGGETSAGFSDRIRDKQGGGAPLEPPVRTSMETAFGHDFANVRVHADGEADLLNRGISASAFTLGSDIFLSREATAAGPYGGDRLLAHELTHVVQQDATEQSGPLIVGPASDPSEREADAVGTSVAEAINRPPPAPMQQPEEGSQTGDATQEDALAPGDRVRRASQTAAVIGRSRIQRGPTSPAPPVAAPPDPAAAAPAPATAPPGATPAPSTGYKGPITIDSWQSVVTPGPVPSGIARDHTKSYIGDQHVIMAKISGELAVSTGGQDMDLKQPADAGLHQMELMVSIGGSMSEFKTDRAWQGPDTVKWTLTPTTPGQQHVTVSVADAEWQNAQDFELDIAAGADPTWFKGRCSTAETTLNTLHAAGRGWFADCFASYKQAYDSFNGALRKQHDADQLTQDMILGVLFAAIGGAAGGVAAAAVSPLMAEVTKAGKIVRPALFNATTRAALTDAAKDVAKFVARIPSRQSVGGSKGGAPPAATTDPAQAAAAQGEGAVPAVDPLTWLVAIDGGIAKERAEAGAQLEEAQKTADEAAILDPTTLFDWDPVAVITMGATLDGKPLDNLGTVPQAIAYERSFWETWLTNYAYKAFKIIESEPQGGASTTEYVSGNVGGKLHDEIDKVAQKFGETADQWIERFGGPKKDELQKNAEAFNGTRG